MRNSRILDCAALVLLTLPASHVAAQDADKLWKAHRNSVAELIGWGNGVSGRGTGFLISDDILITNAHVIADMRTMSAKFDDGTPIDITIVDTNPAYDLAAVKLAKGLPGRALQFFEKAEEDPKVGTQIVIIGHPERFPTTMHRGTVSADPISLGQLADLKKYARPMYPDTKLYQLNVTSTQGMSGAPVLNLDGRLIGVQQQGWQPGLTDINFCIPHSYVQKLDLKKAPVALAGGSAPYDPASKGNLQGLRDFSAPPAEDDPAKGLDEFFCRQWGAFPADPGVADFVFHQIVGESNKERFQRVIPYAQLQQICARNPIAHIINPGFGFGFLVPEGWIVKEEMLSKDPKVFRITVTSTDETILPPYNELRIVARIKDEITVNNIDAEIRKLANEYPVKSLKVRIHPVPPPGVLLPPGTFRDDNDVHFNPLISDPQPTIHPHLPIARLHTCFDSFVPVRNSRIVNYAISGSVVLITEFEYPTLVPPGSPPGLTTKDLAERRFMAETIGLLTPASPVPALAPAP